MLSSTYVAILDARGEETRREIWLRINLREVARAIAHFAWHGSFGEVARPALKIFWRHAFTMILAILKLRISMSAIAACFNAGGDECLADEANNAGSFVIHRSLSY